MMQSLIVTGNDTGIGKTLLSTLLMVAHPEYHYWKPVQSGLAEETDSETVARISEASPERILPECYRLSQPLSPHASARIDGITIETQRLALPPVRPLIVEGAGGLLVPLNDNTLFIERFRNWQLPVLLACRSALGTINHTLLSLEALRIREIDVAGLVMIGELNASNEDAVEHYGKIEIVGRIPPLSEITPATLQAVYHNYFSRLDRMLCASSTQKGALDVDR